MQNQDQTYLSLLEQFDLNENDIVFISSDISKLALNFKKSGFPFNPDHFIDVLQGILKTGTIVIPAYTDLLKNGETYDRQKSKPTTGALSNRVFKRKDFQRTLDPLHSVFVWGKHSQEILELEDESTFGNESIFGFLDRKNAKMIIIDVHFQNSFTFVHYIEEKVKVHFRKAYHWKINVINNNLSAIKEIIFHTKKPGYLVDLFDLQSQLIKDGVVKEKEIHGVNVLFLELAIAGRAIEKYLASGGKTYSFSFKEYLKSNIKMLLGKK